LYHAHGHPPDHVGCYPAGLVRPASASIGHPYSSMPVVRWVRQRYVCMHPVRAQWPTSSTTSAHSMIVIRETTTAFRNTTSLYTSTVSTSTLGIDFTSQYGRGSCRRRTGGVRIQAPASKGHDRKSRSFLSKLLPLSQLPYPSPWFTPICVSLVRAATRSLHVHSFELCTI
jgi:hypothetical protein